MAVATAAPVAFAPSRVPQRSGLQAFWSRLRRTRLAPVGLGIVAAFVAAAILAPVLAPYDPSYQNLIENLQPPSPAHLLGTDELGRDVFSRLLFGARVSLTAGVVAVGLALVLGVSLGLVAGYFGGRVDGLIMRAMDGLLAFPELVLALAITGALGPSLRNALIAIGIVYTPRFARLTRGQTLSVRHRDFVEAARALGAGSTRIMLRHVLPNIVAPIIVQASLSVALAILAEASLSFLGLGVQPPEASWGVMVNAGKDYLDLAPWASFAPGVAIFLAVMGFNFLGDGIRDALDPRLLIR